MCKSYKLQGTSYEEKMAEAIKVGKIAWRFSDPEEIVEVLGKPEREEIRPSGGMEMLTYYYNFGFRVGFARMTERGDNIPFGLLRYSTRAGSFITWSSEELLKLRSTSDLFKLDTFNGLSGMDASALDLTNEEKRLRELPFNSLTKWPSKEKLPIGFDPPEILESAKNPGLGLRALHGKGIDGRGVDIAIFDQPLVPDHVELENRLKIIAELGVEGSPPQMHGPGVTSLAVGKTCGVAPKANLYYVSLAMWGHTNSHYIQALENILELNKNKSTNIRVVSISTGMFEHYPQFDVWSALLEKAEMEGVLVITCDNAATKLDYALLRPLPEGDREKPQGYTAGSFSISKGELLVPGDCRTYASELGSKIYTYNPEGGNSWAAPWIAGLAALGFQVNPGLRPADIRKYLMESADDMPYGKVANPERFFEMCKSHR
jgi:hypothetical protein